MRPSGATEARRRLVGYVLIGLVGLAGTLGSWRVASGLSAAQRATEFGKESAEVRAAVVSQLEDALWTLEAIAALWDASKEVEPEEFHAFVRPFLERRPQIEALEWAPYVPRERLAAFESAARRIHGPAFFVHERGPDGSAVPVAPRDAYVPVLFVETAGGVERPAGFDLASEPARREALGEAAGLRKTRLTPPVELTPGASAGPGLLAMHPVFRRDEAAGAGSARHERLLGYAVGVFRADRVIELGVSHLERPVLDFTVHTTGPAGERLVYRHGSPRDTAAGRGVASEVTVTVGGSNWIIRCYGDAYFRAQVRSEVPAWIFAAGALLTGAILVVYRWRDRSLMELAEANRNLEREVQERRRAERDRERMQKQVIETQKLESLGILAGGIAHDFNNILTAILGNAGLALEQLEPDSAPAHALDRVISASERAALLTRQLLAYAGKGSYRVRPLDLSSLVREMLPLLEASVPKKVEIVLELAEGLRPVAADEAQMHQVVLNLVVNGAEACGDRAGRVVVRTRLSETDETRPVVLEVTDDGSGMDEATQARIFDPFFTTKFTGRGLGLAAVRGIVRSHGATLKVESAPGSGSTFRLSFPATKQPAAAPAPASRPPAAVRGPSRTILVVDDEAMVLELARAALEAAGHRVLVAPDGRRAVEVFRANAPDVDLVVLDMTMPEMNGEETLRALRRVRFDVTVLLSSGYAEDDVTPAFEGHGLAGFLQKPWLPKELLGKVAEILDRAP